MWCVASAGKEPNKCMHQLVCRGGGKQEVEVEIAFFVFLVRSCRRADQAIDSLVLLLSETQISAGWAHEKKLTEALK